MGGGVGIALVVRDEERLIWPNLAYHRALGVERAYVFLDRCRDATGDIAAAAPWAEVLERDELPHERFRSEHQTRVMDEALELARRDGLAWLVHVDADEFVAAARGDIPGLLAGARPEAQAVVFPPLEAVPLRGMHSQPFWRNHWFQRRGALRWAVLDPRTGERRRVEDWLGHYKGKSAVRTSAPTRAASAHRWVATAGDELPTDHLGTVLHFPVIDAEQWQAKYARFAAYPSQWRSGRAVRFPKQLWKEIAPAMSPQEARAYYARWVTVSRLRLATGVVRGHVVRRTDVEDVLRAAGIAP